MKIRILILFLFSYIICLYTNAQKPSVKIDINMEGRSATEVNEPNYTPWFIARVHAASITVSGVTFALTATAPTNTTTVRCGWSKALVQSPSYSRLVNDGVKVDNDTMLAYPGQGAGIELRITGLPLGKHTIQTYHNIWEDTTTNNHCPINVYVNGMLAHDTIKRTVKVISPASATILLTELDVTAPGQEMVVLFESITDIVPVPGKKADLNIYLNAFELNTNDASKQACEPYPGNGDMHADADTGSLTLLWKAAINEYTQSHTVYFGTDSVAVANATNTDINICKGSVPLDTTKYRVDNLYNLNTYYWRIDETDSSGLTTKGKVWSFRPRHLAFKGAEGYGRFAIGGRGGKVVEVTNLNDAGPGSFREAVTNDIGPRTIVFNVSGIIYLNSRLTISSKYVTIAGQTAPGKGICFRGAPLGLGPEGICRFVRMRLGAGTTYDGIGMAGVNNGILDHSSISWTIDEAFSSRNGKNLTLQRCLISEALNIAGHANYPAGTAHGYAATIGGDIGSFHHNLLAHCYGRNWSLGGGLDGNGYYAGRMDIFNNVVYNWGTRATDGGAHEVNFVNNYYKKGVATTQNTVLRAQLEGTGLGTQSYYYAGNIVENTNGILACDGTDNTCSRTYVLSNGQVLNWEVFVNTPFFQSHATIHSAKDAYKSVLSDVGCTLPIFDDHDKRVVNETLTGTYTYTGSLTQKGGIIDHQDEAGGYENYPALTRPAGFDSDHDGMPDWWETLHGSNLNSPQGDFSDSNTDPDQDGYTALEDYLEWMAVPHLYMTENVSDTIELADLTMGYTNNPVFTTESAQNIDIQYNSSSAIITPLANSAGINYIDIKVTDAEGASMIRTIGICVGAHEPPIVTSICHKYDNKNDLQIAVYPSFFDTHLNIETTALTNKSIMFVLIDINGREFLRENINLKVGYNRLRLDSPVNMPSQLYLLNVIDKQSGVVLGVKRVVKK